jgi:hypothetical protein
LLLTLVEADVARTTQLGVLQPLERKESPFQLSQFAQRERQAVLAGIGRELAQDAGGNRTVSGAMVPWRFTYLC